MNESDQELLARAISGEEGALCVLLEQYGIQLHAELEIRIGAKYRGLVDADDIVQVTFLEAFLRIRSFVPREPGSFASWLRRISDNNLRDAIRELEREKRPPPKNRVTAVSDDESYAEFFDHIAGTATTISRAAGRNELKGLIDTAMRKLPRDYEQVLRLYELEGLSAPEVSERMGRSHGAVRMLLARARDCLGELLGSESKFF
ncbi:MAG: sigma-70 family RNA polymerase sigma factor [Planctomycetes bacterium]|nr:sigma-70 family RNA polymerase sigma factor [Planctomycetota bacterium]MBI3834143.1 sigma-70 family RNA polymerase sigma factor [Planctomycetota bacterium]